jgi:phospholipid/cholesterol/gamma-HCH transport system substrate-binding protein
MPSATKTRWSQLKVGIVAAVALAILAVLVITMSGSNKLFQKTSDVFVYFGDSFGMTVGATRVSLNGIPIGKVEKIELTREEDPTRAVRVTMALEQERLPEIPVDSLAKFAQQNLLGNRFINIKRGKSAQTIQPGGVIGTADSAEIEDMLEEGKSTLSALKGILTRVEGLVIQIEDGKGTIGKFLRDETLYNNLVGTTEEVNKLVAAFNNPNSTLGRLINDDDLYVEVRGTVTDLRGTMGKVNEIIDGLNAGEGTLGKLLKDESLHEELRSTIGDLRETLRLINQGDGTIGKLLNTDTLHVRLEGTMSRMDAILDKINSGDGTVGQLLNNPALYESMDGTMREMRSFMKDFRANPKKFLTIQLKLF